MKRTRFVFAAFFISCLAFSCQKDPQVEHLNKFRDAFNKGYPDGFVPADGWYQIKYANAVTTVDDSTFSRIGTGIGVAKLSFVQNDLDEEPIGQWDSYNLGIQFEQFDFREGLEYVERHSDWDSMTADSVRAVYDGDRFFYSRQKRTELGYSTLKESSMGGNDMSFAPTYLFMSFYALCHPEKWTDASSNLRVYADATAYRLVASFPGNDLDPSWRCEYSLSNYSFKLRHVHFFYSPAASISPSVISLTPIDQKTITVPTEFDEDVSGKTIHINHFGRTGVSEIMTA